MVLKLESLALSFSRKNAFLLAAGVRNLKSYESARFARSTSKERNMFRFKEKKKRFGEQQEIFRDMHH